MPESAINCRNVIIDRLENLHQYEHLTNSPQPIHRTEQHPENSNIGDSIGSLFDIPITPQGNDPEEETFRRRMQRKKKKGRRM